jgi:hypothetical protein
LQLPGRLRLNGKPQLSEYSDRAALPAFEITGVKAVAGSELAGGAQDRFGG